MFEKLYTVISVVLWLICIPLDIGCAIEQYKGGRYYRCGLSTMLAALGLMIIAKYLFVG